MDLSPITEAQTVAMHERRSLFITEVMYLSDADEAVTNASGWGQRGKLEWLKATCERYRKDVHKILGD